MGKFSYEMPIELPGNGCALVYTRDGCVSAVVIKRPDQYLATIEEFIELVEDAGLLDILSKSE